MASLKEIRRFSASIAREFHPDRIILFGSHARGEAHADSDVDLLVVVNHEGKPWDIAAAMRQRVPSSFPLDLIVRSPRKLKERIAMGDPFLKEATQEGRILYEAQHR